MKRDPSAALDILAGLRRWLSLQSRGFIRVFLALLDPASRPDVVEARRGASCPRVVGRQDRQYLGFCISSLLGDEARKSATLCVLNASLVVLTGGFFACWTDSRLRRALELAQALEYMHHGGSGMGAMMHRDIKSVSAYFC